MSTKINNKYDSVLALNICNGIRPEINEQEAPKFYINLMTNCWDSDPDKRPSAIEIEKLFNDSFVLIKMKKLRSRLKKQKNIEEQISYLLEIANQFIHKLVILLDYSINL
ncbi:uncharacterized protein OCT59_011547 [Rhizophagus irregularis]|uniref:uncharacterized protein n=1 Tax=Rhizophagus irregularis TaxID=588596 RepID=UPI003332D62D|nr:hypothetical protein OCT59_011547 [Rhizophagus irregularis]